ncbi:extracellular solute-binding protein [Lipingzhangella sp. LS1_29]|uniref:Extracellular solute-binding protein n=1 Tax=Lipingzhangella rawalii TaxID=2055835 RepID=A0ABU2HBG1_9ACTN|nr:extracellular solute-binding protein [Lipingzhangella rawalii]MDS1272638.1 extracellular solute-binding protein [Lipingzhangella rawalii]
MPVSHARRRPVHLAAAALPALALLVSGCATDGTADPDDPDEESLTIYSGRGEELVDPLLDQLEEETGYDISVRYGDTAELAAQLLEEGDRTDADLFYGQDAGALGALANEGMLAELPEDITAEVPEEFRASDDTWVGLSGRSRVIAYDPDQVDTPPDRVLDVAGEEYAGEVAIAPTNASFQAFVTALRVIEGEDATEQWLRDLQDNDVQLYDNNRSMLDALEDGEISLSLNNHYYWYERVKEDPDSVTSELHYLPDGDAGALVNIAGAGVLAPSASEDAALEALEYLLTADAQEYFTDETSEYPVVEGTPTLDELPDLDDLEQPDIDLGDLHALDETLELLEEVGLV